MLCCMETTKSHASCGSKPPSIYSEALYPVAIIKSAPTLLRIFLQYVCGKTPPVFKAAAVLITAQICQRRQKRTDKVAMCTGGPPPHQKPACFARYAASAKASSILTISPIVKTWGIRLVTLHITADGATASYTVAPSLACLPPWLSCIIARAPFSFIASARRFLPAIR